MEKYAIGNNAGMLWNLMNKAGHPMSYEELESLSQLTTMDLNAAIGWLARENRIEIEKKNENNQERMVFYLNMGCYYY